MSFNESGVTRDNLDAFIAAVERFASTKGVNAADRWLCKLNPEVERHIQMEYQSCGDGYTRSRAREIVWFEFANQPLPQRCRECGDVAWYRATVSGMKCQGCGTCEFDKERYLDLA